MERVLYGKLTQVSGYRHYTEDPGYRAAKDAYETQWTGVLWAQGLLALVAMAALGGAMLWAKGWTARLMLGGVAAACLLAVPALWVIREFSLYNEPKAVKTPLAVWPIERHTAAMSLIVSRAVLGEAREGEYLHLSFDMGIRVTPKGVLIVDGTKDRYVAIPRELVRGRRKLTEAEVKAQVRTFNPDHEIWNLINPRIGYDIMPFHENDRYEQRGPFALEVGGGRPREVWFVREGTPVEPRHEEFWARWDAALRP